MDEESLDVLSRAGSMTNFRELRQGEVRRIHLPRVWFNRSLPCSKRRRYGAFFLQMEPLFAPVSS